MTILFCSSLMMSKDYFLSKGYFQIATKGIHVLWWLDSILVGIAGSPWCFVGFPWQSVGMQFTTKTYKIEVLWNKFRLIPDALIWHMALLTKFLEIAFILALFVLLSQKTFVCRLGVFSVHFSVHEKYFNPFTPTGDQDRISPYNINTIPIRQVMRIEKNINHGIISWSNTKFSV